MEYCGCIYIFVNKSFPDFVKIGYTEDVKRRLQDLNSECGTPYPFRAYAKYYVKKPLADKILHRLLDTINPNLRSKDMIGDSVRVREFFKMSCEDAYLLLDSIAKISNTEENLVKLNGDGSIKYETKHQKQKNHKKRLNFKDLQIPVGSFLKFEGLCDGVKPVIFVQTIDDNNKIVFQEITMSISTLTKKLLNTNRYVHWCNCFSYNGVLLSDIQKQIKYENELQELIDIKGQDFVDNI